MGRPLHRLPAPRRARPLTDHDRDPEPVPDLVTIDDIRAAAERLRGIAIPACGTATRRRSLQRCAASSARKLIVTAEDRDLHSGLFGGAAANPIHILVEASLPGLHDETGPHHA